MFSQGHHFLSQKECRYLRTGNILNGNLTHQNNHLYHCLFRLPPSFCSSTSRIAWTWQGLRRYLDIRCGLNCPYDFLIEFSIYCCMEITRLTTWIWFNWRRSRCLQHMFVTKNEMNAIRKVICTSYSMVRESLVIFAYLPFLALESSTPLFSTLSAKYWLLGSPPNLSKYAITEHFAW